MEGELGSGARIAIALIVVGVIIGIIFVILGFTKSTTGLGVSTVQGAMDQMQGSTFDDYDQQVLSGTQTLSALKLFEGRPIGMIVITTLSKAAGYGINYGARFTDTAAATNQINVGGGSGLTRANATDSFYTENLVVNAGGTMTFNMNTLQTKRSGTNEFIRPTAKFQAELIKDSSGTITGICFTQL